MSAAFAPELEDTREETCHIIMDWTKRVLTLILAFTLASCTQQTATPVPVSPTALAAAVQETTETDQPGQLVSLRTEIPPLIDGQVDESWSATSPLQVPLTWGMGSSEHALDVELRSTHTDETISFLAQWAGEPPSGQENTTANRLTVHWRIPEKAAQYLDCTVVCHTASVDGNGHLAYANTETIPQGGSDPLEAAGGWFAGIWTFEWSRPLISANPFDLQFDDLDQVYTFMVKVFERVEGRPDPVSERHQLVFQP